MEDQLQLQIGKWWRKKLMISLMKLNLLTWLFLLLVILLGILYFFPFYLVPDFEYAYLFESTLLFIQLSVGMSF